MSHGERSILPLQNSYPLEVLITAMSKGRHLNNPRNNLSHHRESLIISKLLLLKRARVSPGVKIEKRLSTVVRVDCSNLFYRSNLTTQTAIPSLQHKPIIEAQVWSLISQQSPLFSIKTRENLTRQGPTSAPSTTMTTWINGCCHCLTTPSTSP